MSIYKILLYAPIEIVFCAFLYIFIYFLNDFALSWLEEIQGVHWIFLPAGLRIFITLIFNINGAIGLLIGSALVGYLLNYFAGDLTTLAGAAIISALSPWLGRFFVIHNLDVEPDLSNLTSKDIYLSVIVYAFISSLLHQIWFSVRGLESGSIHHFIAMFIGDILGSLIIITFAKFLISVFTPLLTKKNTY